MITTAAEESHAGILPGDFQVQRPGDAVSAGGDVVRRFRTVVPVLALVAVVAGCASSEGTDGRRLTEQR
ncbi:hypothetical protein [Streptomyces atroolivaceus]|uniref:Uncharacterized protein n=1 Tax=Streptomyces atroolivaceus TaxID=66869 RepID=A0ABV9VCV9_STRAZ|nr:hypothetical protein [Streptomyces atroolivaceus]